MKRTPGTVPAQLILSCIEKEVNESIAHWDEAIKLRVVDFPIVPIGTMLTIYHKKTLMFDEGVVRDISVNNRHGGLLVDVDIHQPEWKRIFDKSIREGSYTLYMYPKRISIFNNK